MDLLKPRSTVERLARFKAEDLLSVLTVPYLASCDVPIERHDTAGPERLFEPTFSLQNSALMKPPLAEECRQDERTERSGQNGCLGGQDAFFNRQTCVAKNANGKRCRPHNRDGAHESRCCGKGRLKTSSNPNEQWAQCCER